MYTFVLEWTPALTQAAIAAQKSVANANSGIGSQSTNGATKIGTIFEREFGTSIPHGYIFATFMLAVMAGSSIFRILCKFVRPESFMRFVLLVASISLLPPIICPLNLPIVFSGFVIFEMCVGVFWPAMGFMRGIYIPEGARSTLMSFFRVPLNFIVVAILFNDLPMKWIFQFCVFFLALACILQIILSRIGIPTSSTLSIVPKLLPRTNEQASVHKSIMMDSL